MANNRQIFQLDEGTPTLAHVFAFQKADGSTEAEKATIEVLAGLMGAPVTVKRSITSAEILAGFTTPIDIVAAPGANKIARVLSAVYRNNFNTAAYTSANTSTLHYNGSTANIVTANTAILPATANLINIVSPIAASFLTGSDNPINKSIQWSVSGNNPATGDGTIDVWVTYIVVDLS